MSIRQTKFAVYSEFNKTINSGTILTELWKLQSLDSRRNQYVVFEPRRGIWLIAEFMTQHINDHGDDELHFGTKERKP